jgi:hypothetical protein
MPSTRYLGSITPPPPSVAVVGSGGSISTETGTWYFWLVNRCVGGFTKASTTSTTVTVASGDRLDITIPSAARTTGSDVREFYILANTTNDSTTASIIASYPGYFLDAAAETPSDYSETPRTLPGFVSITTDEQLQLNTSVTLLADLPSGADLVNGMIRQVDETGTYLTYNAALGDWFALYPQTVNPNVTNTSDPAEGGCDRDIRAIPSANANQIIVPAYGLTGVSRAVPIIIVNTESTNIVTGKPVEAKITVNGIDFTKYSFFTPRGIVNLTTGSLDVSGQPSIGGSFAADGSSGSVITLEKDLEPGKGFWFDVRIEASTADLGNVFQQGSYVEFYADFSPVNSSKTPDAGVFGDIIGPVADYGRIVPNGPTLTPLITSRAGKIRGYTFPVNGLTLGAAEVTNVALNTADQNIVLTTNGTAFRADTTPPTASLRAIISTENGAGAATAFAGSYAVNNTKILNITLNHPSTVRSDYPDILGTDAQAATLNASKVRVYIRPTGGGDILYYDKAIAGTNGEVITVGNSAGTNIGATLPVVDADFGLFAIASYSPVTSAGGSTFATGTVEVAIAYLYEGTVTRITHDPTVLAVEATAQGDPTRYVREVGDSFWALFGLLDSIGLPLSTVVEARALTTAETATYKLFFVAETEKLYYWNPISVDPDNGNTVLKPTAIATGRLVAISGGGGAGSTASYITSTTTLNATESLDCIVDASAGAMTITLPEVADLDPTIKYRLIRLDETENSVAIALSGVDVINRTVDTSTFLGAGEVLNVLPDKDPTDAGYIIDVRRSLGLQRREKITGDRIYFISSSGNDNNTGLSADPGGAFQTLAGFAAELNRLDLDTHNIDVYLEAGDTINLSPTTGTVTLNPYSSAREGGGNFSSNNLIQIVGDIGTPPTLMYAEDNNLLKLTGDRVQFAIGLFAWTVDLGVTLSSGFIEVDEGEGSATIDVIIALSSFNRLSGGAGGQVIEAVGKNVTVTLSSLTANCDLVYFANLSIGARLSVVGVNTLSAITQYLFIAQRGSIIDQSSTITQSGSAPVYYLTTGAVFYSNNIVVPGADGIIATHDSFYSYLGKYNKRTTNLGTFAATTSVNWNLNNGIANNHAAIALTNGTLTWTVSNVPSAAAFSLTGTLDIDISTGANIVLPVGWQRTTNSLNPNLASGLYAFLVEYNLASATTFITFSPLEIKGGVNAVKSLGTITTGTNKIDWSYGATTATINGTLTFSHVNIGSGYRETRLNVLNFTSGTVTWGVTAWVEGNQPTTLGKPYEIRFFTYDGGTTKYAEFKRLGA